jgi:hypothetical protein
MEGSRSALIVAVDTYEDPQLARLRAPGRDAEELAAVLRDPAIGGFDVRVSTNQRHYEIRVSLEDFFADRRPEDVLLLHFSCHGIKDDAGRLFFAASDTQKSRLNATGIAADYVNDLLNHARSRRVVLLLDCCFSGAFTRGMVSRGDQSLDVAERLQGRGRAVLTASGALEYAWEGDDLTRLNEPSVFTGAVVKGLRSGEADRDGDQRISVDELYDYVFDEVRSRTPNQTPGKWSNVEGLLVVARNPRPVPRPAGLPADLQQAVEDERGWVRAGAVERLAQLAQGPDPEQALAATHALRRLAEDDSRRVSSAAERALGGEPPERPAAVAARDEPGPPVAASTGMATATQVQRDWMPAAVVAGGWLIAWVVSMALATSGWVEDRVSAVVLALVGWVVASPLVAAGLRWAFPGLPAGRSALIALGWPVCMVVGLAVPIALRFGYPGAAVLGLAVAVAGVLGAVALVPRDRAVPWERVLVVAAGWCAGWLWPGTTAWPIVFLRFGTGYVETFVALQEEVSFLGLVAGGVLSGSIGGILMYLLLRPVPRARAVGAREVRADASTDRATRPRDA